MASKRVAGFSPDTNGMRFTNHFPAGIPIVNVPLPGTGRSISLGDASNGVCGGMVYAALDLFLARPRLRVPEATTPPVGGSNLMTYVAGRLIDSFALAHGAKSNVARYLRMMSTPDRDEFLIDGIGTVMGQQEWPRIKRDIDADRPSPLGLVAGGHVSRLDLSAKIDRLGHCHQVLAYGYDVDDAHRLTLHVYDPNDPGTDTSTIEIDLSHPSAPPTLVTQRISSRIAGNGTFRAFFRHDYYAPVPPPAGVSPGPA